MWTPGSDLSSFPAAFWGQGPTPSPLQLCWDPRRLVAAYSSLSCSLQSFSAFI